MKEHKIEDPNSSRRTAKVYTSVRAVQIYGSDPELTEKDLFELANVDLYNDGFARIIADQSYGVRFFRDSKNSDGAVADCSFKGHAYYYQYYVDKKTGEVVQVSINADPVTVLRITPATVTRTKGHVDLEGTTNERGATAASVGV